jgi:hypothetical protein
MIGRLARAEDGGEPPDESRVRCMRVDDLRAVLLDHAHELKHGSQVCKRRHLRAQVGEP